MDIRVPLTLVVVEDGLWQGGLRWTWNQPKTVLILVLMEDGLWPGSSLLTVDEEYAS